MTELLQKLLDAIKGLTFVNVAVLAALVMLGIPAYFVWTMLHDPNLMGAVLNVYSEIDVKGDCSLAYEQPGGGQGRWVIRAVLAERNRETWYTSVKIAFKPDDKALMEYCEALTGLVEFARDPYHEPVPHFPGSSRLIVPVATPAN